MDRLIKVLDTIREALTRQDVVLWDGQTINNLLYNTNEGLWLEVEGSMISWSRHELDAMSSEDLADLMIRINIMPTIPA